MEAERHKYLVYQMKNGSVEEKTSSIFLLHSKDEIKSLKKENVECVYCSQKYEKFSEELEGALKLPVTLKYEYDPWDVDDSEIKSLVNDPAKESSKGESFYDFKDKFLDSLREVMDEIEEGEVGNVVIATHPVNLKLARSWGEAGFKQRRDNKDLDLDCFFEDAPKCIEFKYDGNWKLEVRKEEDVRS